LSGAQRLDDELLRDVYIIYQTRLFVK